MGFLKYKDTTPEKWVYHGSAGEKKKKKRMKMKREREEREWMKRIQYDTCMNA